LGSAYEARALIAAAQVLRRDKVHFDEALRREESLFLRLRTLIVRSAGTPEASFWDLHHMVSRAVSRCLLIFSFTDPAAISPALLGYDREVFEMHRMVATSYGGPNLKQYLAQIVAEFYGSTASYFTARRYVAAAVACKEKEVHILSHIERPSMSYARALWSLASLMLKHSAPSEERGEWRLTPEEFIEHVHGEPREGQPGTSRGRDAPRDDWRGRAEHARLAAAAEFAAVGGESCKAARVARAAIASM
jgi:hypothetical protein